VATEPNTADVLIRIEDLSKQFVTANSTIDRLRGRKRRVLRAVDEVSLEIRRGEVLALVGETGSGKTTLGRCLLGYHQPTSGRLWYEDVELTALSPAKRQKLRPKMQMVFQNPYGSLNPRMKVIDMLTEPLNVHMKLSKAAARTRAMELLDLVGLPASAGAKFPSMFSGGQRQRLSIARALSVNPSFVVADEPVSALDVSIQAQILRVLEEIRRQLGLTILFITHDLSVVRHVADRVAVMYLGRVVELAEVEELFRDPKHPYTRGLLEAVPSLVPGDAFRASTLMTGEIPSALDLPSGCHFNPRCGFARSGCLTNDPKIAQTDGHASACWADLDPVQFARWTPIGDRTT
jgi:oligopeptide/dipeptide ABC transporter ATP-binding protein